jgi:DNA-binding protein H-NS
MPRTASLKVIERKIRQLQAQAEKLERKDKPGIRQLRAVLVKYRLGPADVRVALDGRGGRTRRSALAGRKVRPKYRNPGKRSETWTGRGRMPRWMAALVKKGKKPNDFLIAKKG